MNKHVRTPALLSILSAALVACASSPDEPTAKSDRALDQLAAAAERADGIFVGEVVEIAPGVSDADADGVVIPVHFVTFRVDQAVRGIGGATWTGRFGGGTLPDGRTLWVSEVPEFELGQRALVLATHGDVGLCPMVECREGFLPIGDGPGLIKMRAIDEALAHFDASRAGLARSADPRQPFSLDLRAHPDRVTP